MELFLAKYPSTWDSQSQYTGSQLSLTALAKCTAMLFTPLTSCYSSWTQAPCLLLFPSYGDIQIICPSSIEVISDLFFHLLSSQQLKHERFQDFSHVGWISPTLLLKYAHFSAFYPNCCLWQSETYSFFFVLFFPLTSVNVLKVLFHQHCLFHKQQSFQSSNLFLPDLVDPCNRHIQQIVDLT